MLPAKRARRKAQTRQSCCQVLNRSFNSLPIRYACFAAISKQNEAWFSKDRTAQAAADLLVQLQGSPRSSHRSWEFQQAEVRSFTQGAIFQATPCSNNDAVSDYSKGLISAAFFVSLCSAIKSLRGMPLAPGKVMSNISTGWGRIVRRRSVMSGKFHSIGPKPTPALA